jgi:choline dehydrogenase-like flavoprotein
MTSSRNERPLANGERSRLSRLFKVLVVGGAALAIASAITIRGATGALSTAGDDPPDGGGAPGW